MEKVHFFGLLVGKNVVRVDKGKLESHLPIPKNAIEVWIFHGLASFYTRFIKDFSTIATSLNDLVKKNVVFKLGICKRMHSMNLENKLFNELLKLNVMQVVWT